MLVAKKEINIYPEEKIKKVKKRKKNNKKKVAFKLKVVSYAFIMLIVSLAILLRYSYMSQLKYEISEVDKELEVLENEKQELVLKLEDVKESNRIESKAKNELGMVYPSKEQIVYLDVDVPQSNIAEYNIEDDIDNNIENNIEKESNNSPLLDSLKSMFVTISGLF